MQKLVTNEVKATYDRYCDECRFAITEMGCALRIVPGYGHWQDSRRLDFCSDKCIAAFFIKGDYQAELELTKKLEADEYEEVLPFYPWS